MARPFAPNENDACFFLDIYIVVLESFIWICRDESKNGN